MDARSRLRAGRRIVVSLVVPALVGMACTPGAEVTPASAPPAPSEAGAIESGPITLTVWDQEYGKTARVWERLNAEFGQEYPNVTVKRVNRDFGELKALLKLALSGPRGPDVVEVNQGWPDMGQLVKGGLLLPLDNYAETYGWRDAVSENVLSVSSWTPDGTQFGTGNLYGYTTMGEIIGVYYNKDKLAGLGLSVPSTLDGFEHALAEAKAAGEIPIQFANNDKWPGIHEFAVIQDRTADPGYLTDLIFGLRRDQLSFDTPENVTAAATLQDWAERGYFTPGFGGAGYDDSIPEFANGQGVFMITGNWIVADLGADNRDFGFFVLPPVQAGDPPVSTGGAGFPLAIAAGTDHPDASAAYIDWMTSEHASELLLQVGQLPLSANASTASVEPGTVLDDVIGAASDLSDANGVVPYEDWATPTFYDTLTAAIQELMAGRITPEEFAARIQEDYSDFQTSRA